MPHDKARQIDPTKTGKSGKVWTVYAHKIFETGSSFRMKQRTTGKGFLLVLTKF